MDERSSDATALLGMDGFVVRAMDLVDGEWWLLVETRADMVGCPDCGVRAIGHGRSTVQVRDVPIGLAPVRLIWKKRRWRCVDADCAAPDLHRSQRRGRGLAHPPGQSGDLPGGG